MSLTELGDFGEFKKIQLKRQAEREEKTKNWRTITDWFIGRGADSFDTMRAISQGVVSERVLGANVEDVKNFKGLLIDVKLGRSIKVVGKEISLGEGRANVIFEEHEDGAATAHMIVRKPIIFNSGAEEQEYALENIAGMSMEDNTLTIRTEDGREGVLDLNTGSYQGDNQPDVFNDKIFLQHVRDGGGMDFF